MMRRWSRLHFLRELFESAFGQRTRVLAVNAKRLTGRIEEDICMHQGLRGMAVNSKRLRCQRKSVMEWLRFVPLIRDTRDCLGRGIEYYWAEKLI